MIESQPAVREVLVRDRDTGMFHKAYQAAGDTTPQTFDSCAVIEYDQVGHEALELAEPESLCYRDFPPGASR